MSSSVAMVSTVRDDSGRCVIANCVQLSQTVIQCLSFHFLVGYSLMSLRAEILLDYRRFW